MQLPPLTEGIIHRRYQRFLADVELADGSLVVAHVSNTGRMTGCWRPGAPVQLSHSDNPRRKLAWTLERVDMGAGWIGVNTQRVNAVIGEGIKLGKIPGLEGYPRMRAEAVPPIEDCSSRLDWLLEAPNRRPVWVEIKNVTLYQDDCLMFPDAVSRRGLKHLHVLKKLSEAGFRAVILFALNRPEGQCFKPAACIDAEYARSLKQVLDAGVEAIAVRIEHTPTGMCSGASLPVILPA